MTDKKTAEEVQEQSSNAVKDPSDWVTGDEPMTGAQSRISAHFRRKPARK